MSKRINGRNSRPYVKARTEFKNSNGQLYAEWCDTPEGSLARYCVYSYGYHWPLFIYVPHCGTGTWFENKEKYGTTTSRHHTFTHPHCETVLLTHKQMKLLDRLGYSSLVADRLNANKENTNG